VFYHGEAMSNPIGVQDDQVLAEDVGERAAHKLLDEIYNVRLFFVIFFFYCIEIFERDNFITKKIDRNKNLII
jgi:hypothetical protein